MVNLCDLVQFWTSSPALPPAGAQKVSVNYLGDSTTKLMLEANTCPMVLCIPIVHLNLLKRVSSLAKQGFGKM